MTNWETITLTAAVTLIGGTFLFGISEFVKVLVLLPLQKYREQVQIVLDRVDFYTNRITNYFPPNPSKEELQLMAQITADFRSAATGLNSTYVCISLRKPLIRLGVIPTSKKVQDAYGALMYLSNSVLIRSAADGVDTPTENHKMVDRVKSALVARGL